MIFLIVRELRQSLVSNDEIVISQVCVAKLLKRVKRVNKAQGSDGVTNDHNYVLPCICKYCILCILCVYLCNQVKKFVVTITNLNLHVLQQAVNSREGKQKSGQIDRQTDRRQTYSVTHTRRWVQLVPNERSCCR